MPLYKTLPTEINAVDVIIVGGGTAGCIVASRLSDADPSMSILMIEAGPNNHQELNIVTPFLLLSNLMPGSKTVSFHTSPKSSLLADREVTIPAARVLGGGSSINMLIYSRAQQSDFDSWGMPGWSTNELIPYMRKVETFHGNDPKGVHGTDGPIHISVGTKLATRCQDTFIKAAASQGFEETADTANLESGNAVGRAKRFISADGIRRDTAHRYLHPRLQGGERPNLHVLVETRVIRVLLDGEKASGVMFQSAEGAEAEPRAVKANKMVVLSSGACGTPPVLERSGIGSHEVLKRANVPLVVDLPGVGDGYQDHNTMTYIYRSNLTPDETLDGMVTGTFDIPSMLQNRDDRVGWNCVDGNGKIRPNNVDVAGLGPDFQKLWDQEYKDKPDRPLAFMTLALCGAEPVGEPGQFFSFLTFTAYPSSRGHLHISGPGLDDPLDFDPKLLSDKDGTDILCLRWAYKKQREIARRMDVFRGEVARKQPQFSTESKARVVEHEASPPSYDVADIEYSAEDDAAIDQHIRENTHPTWHSLGTCKMASRADGGVVEERLNVYGVTALKIADLSICPRNVAAHTNATAMMVGEKAADIIIQDLNLHA